MVRALSKRQLVLNLMILASACLAMYVELEGNRDIYVFLKPLTTILIMSHLFFLPKNGLHQSRIGIIAALFFCLLGDVLLLFESYFVHGLAAFLVGHILFAVTFIKLKGFYGHWVSFLLLYGVGISLFFWLRPGLGGFMVPVAVYVMVICFMAWQGIGLFLRERSKAFLWIAVAVLLFMFSDTMIAIAKFKTDFDYSSILILSTYWLSIGLMANAAFQIVLTKNRGSNLFFQRAGFKVIQGQDSPQVVDDDVFQ